MVPQRRVLTARQRYLRGRREDRGVKGRARAIFQELRKLPEFRGATEHALLLLEGEPPVWVRDGWDIIYEQCRQWCRQQGMRLTARVMARWRARSELYRCGACGCQLDRMRDGPLQTCCIDCIES